MKNIINNTVAMAISLWNKKNQQLDSEFHVWRARVDRDCSNSHSRKTVDKSYICKQIKPQNTPMSTNHYSKTNMSTPDDATKQHKTTFWYLKKQHVFLCINNLKSCILILTVYQYHRSYYY